MVKEVTRKCVCEVEKNHGLTRSDFITVLLLLEPGRSVDWLYYRITVLESGRSIGWLYYLLESGRSMGWLSFGKLI